MDKTTRKRLEDKFEELAQQVTDEMAAGVRSNLKESLDILQKTEDSASKLTAAIDLKWKPGTDQLQVVLTWTAEGKLKTKSEPFGFNFELGAVQGTLPGMDGKDAPIDVPDETPQARLLSAPPKQLPAPEDVVEGEATDVEAAADGEAVVVAPDSVAVKIKSVTISNTAVNESSIREHPDWYRELTTTRKSGLFTLGEVFKLFMKNPDYHERFSLGLYRLTDVAPAYQDEADYRSIYTFTKLDEEA